MFREGLIDCLIEDYVYSTVQYSIVVYQKIRDFLRDRSTTDFLKLYLGDGLELYDKNSISS